eukprot:250177-Chlamydomonas_euryale.AAC.2
MHGRANERMHACAHTILTGCHAQSAPPAADAANASGLYSARWKGVCGVTSSPPCATARPAAPTPTPAPSVPRRCGSFSVTDAAMTPGAPRSSGGSHASSPRARPLAPPPPSGGPPPIIRGIATTARRKRSYPTMPITSPGPPRTRPSKFIVIITGLRMVSGPSDQVRALVNCAGTYAAVERAARGGGRHGSMLCAKV